MFIQTWWWESFWIVHIKTTNKTLYRFTIRHRLRMLYAFPLIGMIYYRRRNNQTISFKLFIIAFFNCFFIVKLLSSYMGNLIITDDYWSPRISFVNLQFSSEIHYSVFVEKYVFFFVSRTNQLFSKTWDVLYWTIKIRAWFKID